MSGVVPENPFVGPGDPTPRRFNWGAAVLAFLVLAIVSITMTWPPLPAALHLRVILPQGEIGKSEPLITTGEFTNGDLLVIRYEAAGRAVFAYDAWGAGGPVSAPFTYEAGSEHRLDIEMPAFAELPGASTRATAPLRLALDGVEMLRADVPFHRRQPDQIYFAENPIGGSTGAVFAGKLLTARGRALKGGPATFFSPAQRVWQFFARPLPLIGVLVMSAAVGFVAGYVRAAFRRVARGQVRSFGNAPPHTWFVAVAAIAVVAFTYLITDETWRLAFPESFSSFYDYQALSLLHGQLDVPEASLSGEAFFYQGKCFGYFGPTPALMRLPFALLAVGIGKLGRSFMVLDYGLCLVAAYLLLCHAVRLMGGKNAWPSRWATIVFTTSVSLGSTLFFLSSRAYIYHEAILCGAAFGLWSAYFTLRYIDRAGGRAWIGALLCGTLAVHARPPIGLFALVLLGVAAALHLVWGFMAALRSRGPTTWASVAWKKPIVVGLLSVAGVLSFNGLSYLKFGTIEGCPLRYNVQYTPSRLARIDGKQFHWSNLRFGLDTYVVRPTVRLGRNFPYFFMEGIDASRYPNAKLDLVEPMAGLPYAMPALFLLALVGLAPGPRRTLAMRHATLAVWIAIVPPAVAMFAAIAVSHRYTTDFLPFLVAAAALGTAVLDSFTGIFTNLVRALLVIACVLSVAITLAFTVRHQGEGVWGVPEETQQHYRELRDRIDRFFSNHPG